MNINLGTVPNFTYVKLGTVPIFTFIYIYLNTYSYYL